MKRLVTAIVFIFIGTSFAIMGYFNLRYICNDMNNSLNEIIFYVQEDEKQSVIESTKKVKDKWDKKNPLLGVYTNHSEIDELQIIMKSLVRLSEEENFDELIDECYECIYHFEHIKETETPSFGNVF